MTAELRRVRAAKLSVNASLVAKFITVGSSFLIVPIVQRSLGPELFGVWATIASLMMFLAFADFGVGNGVMNAVARAFGRGDISALKEISSTAAFTLALLGVMVTLLLVVVIINGGGEQLISLREGRDSNDLRPALYTFALLLGVNVAFGWIARMQMGIQEGYLDAVSQAVGGILSVLGAFLAASHEPRLWMFVLASVGGPVVASMGVGVWFFFFKQRELRPTVASANTDVARGLIRAGGLFFVLQSAGAVGFSSDNVVLAHHLGPSLAGDYSIVTKLFSAATVIVALCVAPLWPAYAEAHSRGDVAWVARTLGKSLVLCVSIAGVVSCAVVFGYATVTRLWLGSEHAVPAGLLGWVALWVVCTAAGQALAVFLNGLEIVRPQIVCSIAFASIGISLKFLLVPKYGVIAIPIVGVVVYSLTHLIPYFFYIRHWLSMARTTDALGVTV